MDKKTEALKLALEALEAESICANRYDDAIIAVREALAEQPAQQQEPVAIVDSTISGHINWLCTFFPKQGTKLYTSPPIEATARASKPWVGLTDEEVQHEWVVWRASIPRYMGFAKGIEAKLKEKNNG